MLPPQPPSLEQLLALIQELYARIEVLEEENKRLREDKQKNSGNTNNPSSTERFVKPQSLRPKSTRKVGGQKGHPGHYRAQSDKPDVIAHIRVDTCSTCAHDLTHVHAYNVVKRQVWDPPPPNSFHVTEYQAQSKICPKCAAKTHGVFPPDVKAAMQYGKSFQALGVLMHTHHGLPFKRATEMLEVIYGVKISAATLESAQTRAAAALKARVDELIPWIQAQPVAHADETGGRVAGTNQWFHVFSNEKAAHFEVDPGRGHKAMSNHLANYTGVLVHDHWASYGLFKRISHSFCNAHILRELTFLAEVRGLKWAQAIKTVLQTAYQAVVAAKKAGQTELTASQLADIDHKYSQLVAQGLHEHPPAAAEPGKRGRVKNSKEWNLLTRLEKQKTGTLLFAYDFRVPFDNNLAERDVRMLKVILKVAGCFRTFPGAERHATIRSFLTTCQKNGLKLHDSLTQAFRGDFDWPFLSLEPS